MHQQQSLHTNELSSGYLLSTPFTSSLTAAFPRQGIDMYLLPIFEIDASDYSWMSARYLTDSQDWHSSLPMLHPLPRCQQPHSKLTLAILPLNPNHHRHPTPRIQQRESSILPCSCMTASQPSPDDQFLSTYLSLLCIKRHLSNIKHSICRSLYLSNKSQDFLNILGTREVN